jgi:hypothetical protein
MTQTDRSVAKSMINAAIGRQLADVQLTSAQIKRVTDAVAPHIQDMPRMLDTVQLNDAVQSIERDRPRDYVARRTIRSVIAEVRKLCVDEAPMVVNLQTDVPPGGDDGRFDVDEDVVLWGAEAVSPHHPRTKKRDRDATCTVCGYTDEAYANDGPLWQCECQCHGTGHGCSY